MYHTPEDTRFKIKRGLVISKILILYVKATLKSSLTTVSLYSKVIRRLVHICYRLLILTVYKVTINQHIVLCVEVSRPPRIPDMECPYRS